METGPLKPLSTSTAVTPLFFLFFLWDCLFCFCPHRHSSLHGSDTMALSQKKKKEKKKKMGIKYPMDLYTLILEMSS